MADTKPKILIAEDNAMNMRLMEMTLNNHSYTLIKANDGVEALEMIQRDLPDLIIMDINLPKMNGLDVTRTLRKIPAFSKTPIIGITAYAMKGDKEKILEAGCDIYLSKPINTRELPIIVAETLEKTASQSRDKNV
jgi:two-component system, cell cycle response regulator DivK